MKSLRCLVVSGAAALCALVLAAEAQPAWAAAGGASWVSAPAEAPPPPSGVQPSPYPLPVGYVGDIEFWQPNRGLLITAGNNVVPMGLYAYDGVSWHQLSTVCGGSDGRIAWAGPDEFWTIADQRPGQVVTNGNPQNISLCHFQNGQVVGSYAMPLNQPNSYKPMNAAACTSPSDCWFGGQLDSAGAFHLHWDGTNVTVVDAPQDHEVAAMTVHNGQIYESVQLSPSDSFGNEDSSHPPLLHLIVPTDPANPFHSLFLTNQDPNCGDFCPPLPDYGTDSSFNPPAPVDPTTEGGLALSSDWRAGATDPQLWAAAGFDGTPTRNSGLGNAHPVVLRYADGAWTQAVPNLVSLDGDTPLGRQGLVTPSAQSVAAEPNASAAWIAVISSTSGPDNQAHVDRIALTGTTSATVTHYVLGTNLGVGPRGNASAIACPAAQECWLATDQGWLFHLTDGTQLPQDTDPNFAGVITFRPPDGGVPSVLPDQVNVAETPGPPPPVTPVTPPPRQRVLRAKPLLTHLSRSRLVHRTTLVLSFTLTAAARVQLIARRHGRAVAETRRMVMNAGRHTLLLRLDPRHWPTALALDARALSSSVGQRGKSSTS
jgi:hypothetical protein